MNCPRCGTDLRPGQTNCPSCRFHLEALTPLLGHQWVRLERLIDAAHCLRLKDSRKLEAVLDEFERRFPQSFVAVYLGVLPHGLNVVELGFWLLNYGAFSTHEMSKRNDFGIIIVIDPATHLVGISLGYAIEQVIPAKELAQILQAMTDRLWHSEYRQAVELAVKRIDKRLRSQGRCMPRTIDSTSLPGSTASDLGLHPLRAGHSKKSAATASDRRASSDHPHS